MEHSSTPTPSLITSDTFCIVPATPLNRWSNAVQKCTGRGITRRQEDALISKRGEPAPTGCHRITVYMCDNPYKPTNYLRVIFQTRAQSISEKKMSVDGIYKYSRLLFVVSICDHALAFREFLFMHWFQSGRLPKPGSCVVHRQEGIIEDTVVRFSGMFSRSARGELQACRRYMLSATCAIVHDGISFEIQHHS